MMLEELCAIGLASSLTEQRMLIDVCSSQVAVAFFASSYSDILPSMVP